jgi:hypothetical protein
MRQTRSYPSGPNLAITSGPRQSITLKMSKRSDNMTTDQEYRDPSDALASHPVYAADPDEDVQLDDPELDEAGEVEGIDGDAEDDLDDDEDVNADEDDALIPDVDEEDEEEDDDDESAA